jgi:hypothetical protein
LASFYAVVESNAIDADSDQWRLHRVISNNAGMLAWLNVSATILAPTGDGPTSNVRSHTVPTDQIGSTAPSALVDIGSDNFHHLVAVDTSSVHIPTIPHRLGLLPHTFRRLGVVRKTSGVLEYWSVVSLPLLPFEENMRQTKSFDNPLPTQGVSF